MPKPVWLASTASDDVELFESIINLTHRHASRSHTECGG